MVFNMLDTILSYIEILPKIPPDYFNAVMFFGFFYYLCIFNIFRISFFFMRLFKRLNEFIYYLYNLYKTKLKSILRKDDINE